MRPKLVKLNYLFTIKRRRMLTIALGALVKVLK
jgi:hypothetical protein